MAGKYPLFSTLFFNLLRFHSAEASLAFRPNCTLPAVGTNFVAYPNARGTLPILWNCILISVLCTWSILHLNVPAIRSEPKGWWQQQWWLIQESFHRVKWMVITIFVPELIMAKALTSLLGAHYAKKTCPQLAPNLAQGYLHGMGYFVLDTQHLLQRSSEDDAGQPTANIGGGDQASDQASGGAEKQVIVDEDPLQIWNEHPPRFRKRYWALNFPQWKALYDRFPDLVDFPQLSFSQREQLSQNSALVKILALIQLFYLIVELICRKIKSLPASQIEISALAFAVCSIVIYGLYWCRPQDVKSICIIRPKETLSKAQLDDLLDDPVFSFSPKYIRDNDNETAKFDARVGPLPIPNDAIEYSKGSGSIFPGFSRDLNVDAVTMCAVAAIGGTIFGGVHALAWNFDFPTPGERVAWRVCSLVTTAVPLVTFVLGLILFTIYSVIHVSHPVMVVVDIVAVSPFSLAYALARLFIIAESIRTLFFLPPRAYIATWAGNSPHY